VEPLRAHPVLQALPRVAAVRVERRRAHPALRVLALAAAGPAAQVGAVSDAF
jgi:hypothetical protein